MGFVAVFGFAFGALALLAVIAGAVFGLALSVQALFGK